MLTIYHVPGTRGVRAIWLCQELGTPYPVEPVDLSPAFRRSAPWRALNPVGKVPRLRDTTTADHVTLESGVIAQCLLARHGN